MSKRRMKEYTKKFLIDTTIEDQFISENYLIMPIKTMAKMIGRSHTFVRGHLSKLNLIIPPELALKRKLDSRKKKGDVPSNKGKKRTPEQYAKSAPTMFKKGITPHNTKYDGYIVKRHHKHDGKDYMFIRIAQGKFELLHRKVWMDANGEIPARMLISFKNGDTLDCRLENLEMISMAENMKRNTLHNYPEDIRHNIQLIGVLNRQINKITKNEKQQHDRTEGSPF